jgi:hypothetical protein
MFAEFLPLAWILHSGERRNRGVQRLKWGEAVDPKLVMLIVLFGLIIALSHLSGEQVERMREWIALRRGRKTVPVTDEI